MGIMGVDGEAEYSIDIPRSRERRAGRKRGEAARTHVPWLRLGFQRPFFTFFNILFVTSISESISSANHPYCRIFARHAAFLSVLAHPPSVREPRCALAAGAARIVGRKASGPPGALVDARLLHVAARRRLRCDSFFLSGTKKPITFARARCAHCACSTRSIRWLRIAQYEGRFVFRSTSASIR